MKLYSLGQISPEEKSDILEKHRTVYNGYRTMQPKVSNTQPLYVQDYANDKDGITVTNKGNVKSYTNFGINEQITEKEMCSECGGYMSEGECMECGYKMEEVGEETQQVKDLKNVEDLNGSFDYTENEENIEEQGGNADDMDVSNVEPAYNFVSGGPESGDDYEEMTSAWSDDDEDEYGDSKIDFTDDEDNMSIDDMDDDFGDFDPRDKSWEEIKAHTGNWDEIDEDIKESFVSQKNKINEMMVRMKVI